MSNPLEDPLYYLDNFHQVLDWLSLRYSDVLSPVQQQFIRDFAATEQPSRALLVRLIMRKGVHFRAEKLQYAEIGSIADAVKPLIRQGWVDTRATLMFDELFALLQKSEVLQSFGLLIDQPKGKKADWLPGLSANLGVPQSFEQWCPSLAGPLYSLTIMDMCDRFRLMFFGNLYQDWSQFVLADLGIYTYEKVGFCEQSRGLRSQADVDSLMFLHLCQQAFEAGEEPASVLARINSLDSDNPWLNRRRARLLFQLGQQCERLGQLSLAEQIYRACTDTGARQRLIRVLERSEDFPQAMTLATAAEAAPYNAAEAQHVQRVLPRLRRKLGLPALPKAKPRETARLDLALAPAEPMLSVEFCVQAHLTNDAAPVHYVENSLINSLFGLLCWPAIFAPLPGAFFHPFQRGPVDLHSDDFHQRRAELFDACLAQLQDERYFATLRQRYSEKWGVQSPFVDWNVLTEELLEQALICLPAEHLRHWFERLLLDIRANRAGMPDLIQFFPAEKTYRMIEVKGPGDRLQDNQLRWLAFCNEHQMPVSVCYVSWQTGP